MRWTLAPVALALAACGASAAELGQDPSSLVDASLGSVNRQCTVDVECALASSTCCGCPSFAIPAAGAPLACDGVECPPAGQCPAVQPRCDQGACTVVCAEVACQLSCDAGFAVDALGCQVCACSATEAPQCQVDGDCARVAADCCGCERGGMATAVPATEVESFNDGLGCTGGVACPEVDVCDANDVPRCSAGRCVLGGPTTDPGVPELACGRDDLPTCPSETHCVLNASPDAAVQGIGTCQPL